MADEVIRRSGSSADHGSFTGANGEWTHDTTLKAIRVHDGSQAGGYPIFHEGYVESAPDGGTDAYSADARRPVSAGETVRADFTSANTTTTPTFENTQGTPSGALTITTRDGSALWSGALSGVHTLQLASGGGSWLVLDPNSFGGELLHVQDQKTSGTGGGSPTTGDQDRDLNTIVTNGVSGASLSSNAITLPAGTYYIEVSAPGYRVGRHRIFVEDVTNSIILVTGSSEYTVSGSDNEQTRSFARGRFSLSGSADIKLKHYIETASNSALGIAVSDGREEIYSELIIWKVG